MSHHTQRCGCQYGGPCTRTTLCRVDAVRDEMQEEIDRLPDVTVKQSRGTPLEMVRHTSYGSLAQSEVK